MTEDPTQPARREAAIRAVLTGAIVLLGAALFHLQGSSTAVDVYGRSALVWMARKWNEYGGTMSHGWLIPLVSAWFLWRRRDALRAAPKRVSNVGLSLVILALALHWLGIRVEQSRFALLSLIGLLWAIPYYFHGWGVARLLVFPCGYLLFCIPWNFLDSLTFPLRLFSTSVSAFLLNGLGIPIVQVGTAILSAEPGGFRFDVADPCSGLRSLFALAALTAAYANLTQRGLLKQWVLFLSAVPLAVVGNVARIVTLGIVAQAFGEAAAMRLYHDFSGYLVFAVAVLLMAGFGHTLSVGPRELIRKWKRRLTDRT